MHTCDNCRKLANPVVFVSFNNKLCVDCWKKAKETNVKLVKKLPFIKSKEAPLGYSFVVRDFFKDDEKGKSYATWVFNQMNSGMS